MEQAAARPLHRAVVDAGGDGFDNAEPGDVGGPGGVPEVGLRSVPAAIRLPRRPGVTLAVPHRLLYSMNRRSPGDGSRDRAPLMIHLRHGDAASGTAPSRSGPPSSRTVSPHRPGAGKPVRSRRRHEDSAHRVGKVGGDPFGRRAPRLAGPPRGRAGRLARRQPGTARPRRADRRRSWRRRWPRRSTPAPGLRRPHDGTRSGARRSPANRSRGCSFALARAAGLRFSGLVVPGHRMIPVLVRRRFVRLSRTARPGQRRRLPDPGAGHHRRPPGWPPYHRPLGN